MSGKEKELELKKQILENRKKAIINVAEKIFLTNGYDNTTMHDIANKAGYSKGTVYNYFPSKDEIYLSLGISSYQMLNAKTKEFTQREEPGIAQLMAVGKAYHEFYKDSPDYAMIFHHIGDKFPNISEKPKNDLTPNEKSYLEQSDEYRDIFVGVISQAIKNNKLRTDKDPIMIGITLATLTSGLIKELTRREKNIEQLKLSTDQIVDFVFEMLGEALKPRE